MNTDRQSRSEPVIACHLDAIPPEHRKQHSATGHALYAAVQELQTLPNGYALRLPGESATLLQVADYITNERLCCAFLHFEIEVEPEGGPVWLRLTGGEGVKEYLGTALETLVRVDLAKAAGLR